MKKYLDDFEILKDLIEENIKLEEIDEETKKRIMKMCLTQKDKIDKKINEEEIKIETYKKILSKLNNL